jgi:hypothetical protein
MAFAASPMPSVADSASADPSMIPSNRSPISSRVEFGPTPAATYQKHRELHDVGSPALQEPGLPARGLARSYPDCMKPSCPVERMYS